MARTVIASAEVEQAAPRGRLDVPSDAVITPLARDLAADLGVEITRAGGPSAKAAAGAPAGGTDDLANRVRTILASLLGNGGGGSPAPTSTRRPVIHASAREVDLEPFAYPGPPPEMDVRLADVVDASDGAPVAVGYMSLTKGSFPWTMTYDEVQIILEGELHLGGDGGGTVGRPGDVLFVPKGSSVTFATPTWAKLVYVTFPADWEGQIT